MSIHYFYLPPALEGNKSAMKNKLNQDETTKTLELMKLVHQEAVKARGKSVVYVMGVTGDGKSTLLNDLNNSRYFPEITDGDPVPQWDIHSASEVCKVGPSTSQSETLLPQLIDISYEGEIITYCDLPGLDGSRERSVTVCEAYTPMILNSEVENVRGIIWVLSDLHFRTTRSKAVKEVLSYLLQIAKGNPNTIANSLTIVITKGSDYLKREHVIKKLRSAVAAMLDSSEKDLLNQIITTIENSRTNRIIVSKIFDHQSSYRNEIHQAILSQRQAILNQTPWDKNLFDFSLYSKEQTDFKNQIDKALKHKQVVITESEAVGLELDKCTAQINSKNTTKTQLWTNQEQKKAELNSIKNQLDELRAKSSDFQDQITTIENSNEQKIVHEIKHHIEGQTQEVEIERTTGQFIEREVPGEYEKYRRVEQTVVDYNKKNGPELAPTRWFRTSKAIPLAKFNQELDRLTSTGYGTRIELMPRHLSRKRIFPIVQLDDLNSPITQPKEVDAFRPKIERVAVIEKVRINQQIPMGNLGEYNLSFQYSFPVNIKINNATGWSVKPGSENKNAGYQATIIYERGIGCVVDISISALKKHTLEGISTIASLKDLKNQCEINILSLSQQCSSLEEQISKNEMELVDIKKQLYVLEEQKRQLDEDNYSLKEFLKENQPYFDTLSKLCAMITANSSAPTSQATNLYRFHQTASNSNEIRTNDADYKLNT